MLSRSGLVQPLCVCHRWRHLCRQLHSAHSFQHRYHMLSPLSDHQDGRNVIIPKRHMTIETYSRYFSPESPPIALAQKVLEGCHDLSGLPWWVTIPLTTFALRTIITLPVIIYSQKEQQRVESLKPEIKQLAERLKSEVAHAKQLHGWSSKYSTLKYKVTMKKLIRDTYIQEKCHPAKAFLIQWVQLPIWFSFSFALRNMSGCLPIQGFKSEILCPTLVTEGALWFTNLALPDATLFLPIAFGVINFINIEIGTLQQKDPTRMTKAITWFLRGVIILMVPIASLVPSCMCLYWMSSSIFGLTQNIVMKFPSVRRAVGIKIPADESKTPFQDMAKAARRKYLRQKI